MIWHVEFHVGRGNMVNKRQQLRNRQLAVTYVIHGCRQVHMNVDR